jgi:hypothetical protein
MQEAELARSMEFTIVDKDIIAEKQNAGHDVSQAAEALEKDVPKGEAEAIKEDKDELGVD